MMRVGILILACLQALPAQAAGGAQDPAIPPGALFRHQDDRGVRHMSSVLTEDAIRHGYQVIDRAGRTLFSVDPAPDENDLLRLEQERAAAEAAEAQARRDAELRRLYAAPDDAERARDRQVSALRLRIEYARGSLAQVRARLDKEIATAARMEQSGRPIPEATQAAIAQYSRQVTETEREIARHEQDIVKVRQSFQPIIERLKLLAAQ